MIVKSATKDYEVHIEDSLDFIKALAGAKNAFYVVDAKVWSLYEPQMSALPADRVFKLNATEENKVIDTALAICEAMVGMDAKRNAHLISFGGGITQDVTGFAANVLYRGVKWTYVPTTLLAACDSCIGGKTSLNYKSYKNLLGTFFPPDDIYICPEFFKTLSKPDLESGLGEVVKFNVMSGSDAVADLEQSIDSLLELEPAVVNRFVEKSLGFKKGIIEEDEFDLGRRVLLNFAHTFGHAFEVSSSYVIPHGTAVALGMVAANSASCERGMLDGDIAERVEALVAHIMPEIDPGLIDFEKVMPAIRKDKKQVGSNLTAVLLDSDYILHVVHDMAEEEIRKACAYVQAFLEKCNRS
jgi:3-dehydroquinate synthase